MDQHTDAAALRTLFSFASISASVAPRNSSRICSSTYTERYSAHTAPAAPCGRSPPPPPSPPPLSFRIVSNAWVEGRGDVVVGSE